MDRSCESPAAEIAASMGFDEKKGRLTDWRKLRISGKEPGAVD
jgi:hypothetical protein